MATILDKRATIDQELQSVRAPAWRRGFANLLNNEHRLWWSTHKWLVHLLLWLVVLNGLSLLIGLADTYDATNPAPLYDTLVQVFFQVGTLATAVGVVITAQGVIVGEKQLGTAAWVLSKPVARGAFVLAKFVAYAASFLALAIVLPGAIFYGESLLMTGRVPGAAAFLAGIGIMALHTLFYLALTLMLGTLFTSRGPVSGLALGALFAGSLLINLVPPAVLLALPWSLSASAAGLVLGTELPASWPVPVLATALWTVLLLGVALWRFGCEEF